MLVLCRHRLREVALRPRAAGSPLRHSRLYVSLDPFWALVSPITASQSWCLCVDGNPLYHTSPSNSTPYPSVIAMNNTQARKGFVSYAIAAMRHFKGRGVVWELW